METTVKSAASVDVVPTSRTRPPRSEIVPRSRIAFAPGSVTPFCYEIATRLGEDNGRHWHRFPCGEGLQPYTCNGRPRAESSRVDQSLIGRITRSKCNRDTAAVGRSARHNGKRSNGSTRSYPVFFDAVESSVDRCSVVRPTRVLFSCRERNTSPLPVDESR